MWQVANRLLPPPLPSLLLPLASASSLFSRRRFHVFVFLIFALLSLPGLALSQETTLQTTGVFEDFDIEQSTSSSGGDSSAGELSIPSTRQLLPGTSGVGEVISVDTSEFEKLIEPQQPSEPESDSDDAQPSTSSSQLPSNDDSEHVTQQLLDKRVGLLEDDDFEDLETGDQLGGAGGDASVAAAEDAFGVVPPASLVKDGSFSANQRTPVVVPEDSSRGQGQGLHHQYQQQQQQSHGYKEIDRRKVVTKPEGGNNAVSPGGGGGQDSLSFTGLLNGLLDSFINEPPPPAPSQSISSRHRPTTTPSTPSNEDTSTGDETEDDELESSAEDGNKQPPPKRTKYSSSKHSSTNTKSNNNQDDTSNENASEEPPEDDDDDDAALIEQLNSALQSQEQHQQQQQQQQNSTKPAIMRQCPGECRNIIFGLFLCDEIDNDAYCSEPGLACCVNSEQERDNYRPYGNVSSEEGSQEENINLDLPDDNDDVQGHIGGGSGGGNSGAGHGVKEDDEEEEEEEDGQKYSGRPSQSKKEGQQQHQQSQSQQQHHGSSQKPQHFAPPPPPHKYNTRVPPPPPHYNAPPPHHFYFPHHQQPRPQQTMMMPLPCPRYCVKTFLDQYCSDRLPSHFSCGVDGFCCGHDVSVSSNSGGGGNGGDDEQGLNDDDNNQDGDGLFDGLGNLDQDEDSDGGLKKVIGPCTEEVGSCVSKNIINIICFAHATPTDMYTCPRSSMKCCARKTALPKDSLPTTTSPPPKLLLGNGDQTTRNATSQHLQQQQQQFGKPPLSGIGPILTPQLPQQQQQQIPPQFGPPPHHHQQQQQQSLPPPPPPPPPYNPNIPFVQGGSSSPPLAETPPPMMHSMIPPQQFTNLGSGANAGGGGSGSGNTGAARIPARQPVGSYVCGVKGVPTVSKKKRRRKKRVVGGSDSLPGEWCWQVALINSLNQYLCGGALIGTQWVLTAAHCVTNIVRSGDAIYVRVGDHDLTSRYGSPGAQTLRVATTYIHHNHNSQTLDNDIALLKLQGNAALKEGVCLVCLPSRNHISGEVPGKRCTVTGYGYMGESGPIPLRIREANLPIVHEDECVRKVNAVTEKVFALPMSSFCAGGELRNDACQGDGGGPLVCRADDPSTGDPGTGYYELTGLVSWGFGCGRPNVPGVYVKVSSFIGWIHQIIRSN